MRSLILSFAVSALFCASAAAQGSTVEDSDDLVRLPGQGTIKSEAIPGKSRRGKPARLVPGGGLMMSFDEDQNGRVTRLELSAGVESAFIKADANQDGSLSALEQIAWAEGLLTHDDTLSNPARFDPNLDRMVSFNEFVTVIQSLANDYAEDTGEILVSALRAPERAPDRRELTRLDQPGPNRLERR